MGTCKTFKPWGNCRAARGHGVTMLLISHQAAAAEEERIGTHRRTLVVDALKKWLVCHVRPTTLSAFADAIEQEPFIQSRQTLGQGGQSQGGQKTAWVYDAESDGNPTWGKATPLPSTAHCEADVSLLKQVFSEKVINLLNPADIVVVAGGRCKTLNPEIGKLLKSLHAADAVTIVYKEPKQVNLKKHQVNLVEQVFSFTTTEPDQCQDTDEALDRLHYKDTSLATDCIVFADGPDPQTVPMHTKQAITPLFPHEESMMLQSDTTHDTHVFCHEKHVMFRFNTLLHVSY